MADINVDNYQVKVTLSFIVKHTDNAALLTKAIQSSIDQIQAEHGSDNVICTVSDIELLPPNKNVY